MFVAFDVLLVRLATVRTSDYCSFMFYKQTKHVYETMFPRIKTRKSHHFQYSSMDLPSGQRSALG